MNEVPMSGGEARPRLAVLIPVYNAQDSLDRTLASLTEEPASFDVVIVDDGSRPPVRVAAMIGSHEVTLHRLPKNRGVEHAANAGMNIILTRGYEYVARVDAGDLSVPGRMGAQMAFLDAHRDHGLVGAFVDFVDMSRKLLFAYRPPTDDAGIRKGLRYSNCLIQPVLMLRVSALREVGFYSSEFQAAEDYDMAFRIAERYKVANLPVVYLKYENNPEGISRKRRPRQVLSRLLVEWRYFEPTNVHSYLGMAINAAIIPFPQRVLLAVKKVVMKVSL